MTKRNPFKLVTAVPQSIPAGLYLYKVDTDAGSSQFTWQVGEEAAGVNAESVFATSGYAYIELPLCEVVPTIVGATTTALLALVRK
jgi:hypothetical protein